MENQLKGIEKVLLMGPGPSCVPPEVYSALSLKTLGHLDPYFLKIMDRLKEMLQEIMNTKNKLTLPLSGTGSAGMEACFVNLVEPGDKVLIAVNGVFGWRMKDVAERLGAQVDALEFKRIMTCPLLSVQPGDSGFCFLGKKLPQFDFFQGIDGRYSGGVPAALTIVCPDQFL